MKNTITLWRASDDDICVGTASFSADRDAAEAYLDGENPNFGGDTLWSCELDLDSVNVLDLVDCDGDPIDEILKIIPERSHPGAITADVWIPQEVFGDLAAAGFEWVRVEESYPEGTETWIWIGGDDPDMEEVELAEENPSPSSTTSARLKRRLMR
jgi:hypothetical protein